MAVEYCTSVTYLDNGFEVTTVYGNTTWADTEAESVARAIAGYETCGHTADQLLRIETRAYEEDESP